jgi:hypothetical protein
MNFQDKYKLQISIKNDIMLLIKDKNYPYFIKENSKLNYLNGYIKEITELKLENDKINLIKNDKELYNNQLIYEFEMSKLIKKYSYLNLNHEEMEYFLENELDDLEKFLKIGKYDKKYDGIHWRDLKEKFDDSLYFLIKKISLDIFLIEL